MDIVATLLSLISPQAILELPWHIKGPVLFIFALMIFNTIRSVLKFRLIKAAFSLFYTIILAIMVTTWAPLIGAFDGSNDPLKQQKTNSSDKN